MSKKKDLTLHERIFGKKKTLKERSKEWQRELRKEQRAIERQIKKIEREENKVKAKIKATAKKTSDKGMLLPMAKQLVNTRNYKKRLHMTIANISSCALTLKHQVATVNMVKAVGTSTKVMKAMNSLIKIPELQKTLRGMTKEMYKAGIIEEMTDDAFSAMDPEDIDEQAGVQVDSVLEEILGAQFDSAGVVNTVAPKVKAKPQPAAQEATAAGLDEQEAALSERLKSL